MAEAWFKYKGINSLSKYLRIKNSIIFPSPEADIELIEVLGRDGELVIDNKRLKGVSFPIEMKLSIPKDVDKTVSDVATEISNWLKGDIGWYPLEFSGSPNYVYTAMVYEQFNISERLKNRGHVTINFRLKPYKTLRGQEVETLTNGETLTNEGLRSSKPLIRIDGSGDITLQNNGKDWLKLVDVVDYVNVDSEAMLVYREVSNPQNKKFNATLEPMFPILHEGDNTITWTGNVDSVKIETRWGSIT